MTEIRAAFADVDVRAAGEFAQELADALRQEVPEARVEQVRDDPLRQDFGTTLVIVAATTAFSTLAKGIATYLARRHNAKLVLERRNKNGTSVSVTVEGRMTERNEKLVRDFLDD